MAVSFGALGRRGGGLKLQEIKLSSENYTIADISGFLFRHKRTKHFGLRSATIRHPANGTLSRQCCTLVMARLRLTLTDGFSQLAVGCFL